MPPLARRRSVVPHFWTRVQARTRGLLGDSAGRYTRARALRLLSARAGA
jgi:hypothetical protein